MAKYQEKPLTQHLIQITTKVRFLGSYYFAIINKKSSISVFQLIALN